MSYFDDRLLLSGETAYALYEKVRDLPIIDYHSHLDPAAIARDDLLGDTGSLWLGHDHYKWRAMRLCGVDERFITGDAPYREKFMEFARIMPMLCGNPVYYFSQLELSQIFGVNEPLCAENAERIYDTCNEVLKGMRVSELLKKYRVNVAATTDDPADSLEHHGIHGKTFVSPTFRPDKYYCPDDTALQRLGDAVGGTVTTLDEMLEALDERLAYFTRRGCFMSDHGFEKFPDTYIDRAGANELFGHRKTLDGKDRAALFGYVLSHLMREYKKHGITAQLHFSVRRNVNPPMFEMTGADSGFDVIGDPPLPSDVERFLASFDDRDRPDVVLYTLNDTALRAIGSICGAFSRVRLGAAWWFNDSKLGIKRALETTAEYTALGTSLGMLTDSRSFAGYSRFDFYRRILCDHVGGLVEAGEYDARHAEKLLYGVCYGNAYAAAVKNPATDAALKEILK